MTMFMNEIDVDEIEPTSMTLTHETSSTQDDTSRTSFDDVENAPANPVAVAKTTTAAAKTTMAVPKTTACQTNTKKVANGEADNAREPLTKLQLHNTVTDSRRIYLGSCCGLCVLLGVVLFALFVTGVIGPEEDNSCRQAYSNFNTPFEVRACTLEECFSSGCDENLVPFLCLERNGTFDGGCSAIPWDTTTETCDEQCDRSCCNSLAEADGVTGCNVACDKDWCQEKLDKMWLCPFDQRYQCLKGIADNGCSDDVFLWTMRADEETCSECCNVMSCFWED